MPCRSYLLKPSGLYRVKLKRQEQKMAWRNLCSLFEATLNWLRYLLFSAHLVWSLLSFFSGKAFDTYHRKNIRNMFKTMGYLTNFSKIAIWKSSRIMKKIQLQMLRIWRRDETILYLDDTERVTRRAILVAILNKLRFIIRFLRSWSGDETTRDDLYSGYSTGITW